jgi:hypothetical protein
MGPRCHQSWARRLWVWPPEMRPGEIQNFQIGRVIVDRDIIAVEAFLAMAVVRRDGGSDWL